MQRKLIVVLALLVSLTVVIAAIHKNRQADTADIVITANGIEHHVKGSELNETEFSGKLTNGKGETATHTYRGILLRELLQRESVPVEDSSVIFAVSADNYKAEYSVEEVLTESNVYIAVEIDGAPVLNIDGDGAGAQIIVFGDENSRRCVRFVSRIEIQ